MESDCIGLQSTRMGPRIDIHGVANGGVAKSFLFAHSFAHSHTHSLAHSLAHSPAHSLAHSLAILL
jgi:hypothetical protein